MTSQIPTLADILRDHGYRLEGEGDGFALISKGSLAEKSPMGSIDLTIEAIDPEGTLLRITAHIYAYQYGMELGEAKCNFGPSTTTDDPTYLRAYAAVMTLAAEKLTMLKQALAAGAFA